MVTRCSEVIYCDAKVITVEHTGRQVIIFNGKRWHVDFINISEVKMQHFGRNRQ